MKTCEDCIHYEVCEGYIPTDLDKDIWDLCAQGKSDEIPDIDKRCSSFKDKSRFIELPCSRSLQVVLNNLKPISHKDIEMALKQMETSDDIVGRTIKRLIENSNMEET